MRVLSLFAGIGGFDIGLEAAGFQTVAFCEIEPYCQAVLAKHWPGVPIYDDIRTLTADTLRRDGIVIDAICGGFPCQDLSYAGKRAGIQGARSGLWSEYRRLIGELRPRFAIMENVPGLLSLGMGTVLGDLSALGYSCFYDCIPAAAVGAPHRRDRVWIIAWRNDFGSCEIIRGDAKLQSLWKDVSAASGRGEVEPWSVLLGEMRERGTIRSSSGDACLCQKFVLGQSNDAAGDSGGNFNRVEAREEGACCPRSSDKTATQAAKPKHEVTGDILQTGHDKEGGGCSSSQLPGDGRQAGKSCGCIEAEAWKIAPAIRDYISIALQGWAGEVRPREWVHDHGNTEQLDEGRVNGGETLQNGTVVTAVQCEKERIMAHAQSERRGEAGRDFQRPEERPASGGEVLADTNNAGLEGRQREVVRERAGERIVVAGGASVRHPSSARLPDGAIVTLGQSRAVTELERPDWWQSQSILGRVADGFSSALDGSPWLEEPEGIPRVSTGVENRPSRLKALGNAVVPQVAELIGRAIMKGLGYGQA